MKVGGQPGEYPTVLIGISFTREIASLKIEIKEKSTEQSRVANWRDRRVIGGDRKSTFLDVILDSGDSFIKFIDFVTETIELPFLTDAPTPKIRSKAARYVGKVGLSNRVVYNSINTRYTEEEIDAIKESGIDAAILLCFNPRDPIVEGRIKTLESLLKVAERVGLKRYLWIPVSLISGSGASYEMHIYCVKERFCLPSRLRYT